MTLIMTQQQFYRTTDPNLRNLLIERGMAPEGVTLESDVHSPEP